MRIVTHMERLHVGMEVRGPGGRRLGRVVGFDELSILVGRARRRPFAASLEEIASIDGDSVRLTDRIDTLLHQYSRGQAGAGLDTLVH